MLWESCKLPLIKMTSCPVCLNKNFKGFISFGKIPRSDCYLDSKDSIPNTINLDFEYCNNCAFVRQKQYQPHNYEEDLRKTNHTLMDYCQNIAKSLAKNSGLIVDVGCNDGAFLDLLSKNGAKNLLGVEPSISCASLCKSKGYKINNDFFNKKSAKKLKEKYGSASSIIYRHVLEHVENPFDFLLAAKNFLKENGKLFIEIPDSSNIIYGLNSHELLDQHVSYFTPQNLEHIVSRAGFRVDNICVRPYMGTDAILIFASKNPNTPKSEDYQEDVLACSKFSPRIKNLSDRLKLKANKSKKPLIGLGASHPQSRFFISTGIGEYIYKLVDDDSNKIGKYVFVPKPVPIISTKQFIENPKGTVLDTAFGYPSWADNIEKQTNLPMLRFKKRLNESC